MTPWFKNCLTDYWTLVRVDATFNSLHLNHILISYYYFQVFFNNKIASNAGTWICIHHFYVERLLTCEPSMVYSTTFVVNVIFIKMWSSFDAVFIPIWTQYVCNASLCLSWNKNVKNTILPLYLAIRIHLFAVLSLSHNFSYYLV